MLQYQELKGEKITNQFNLQKWVSIRWGLNWRRRSTWEFSIEKGCGRTGHVQYMLIMREYIEGIILLHSPSPRVPSCSYRRQRCNCIWEYLTTERNRGIGLLLYKTPYMQVKGWRWFNESGSLGGKCSHWPK